MKTKKVFLLIGIILIVALLAGFVYEWYNYSHVEIVHLENMENINLDGKDLNNPQDLSQILEEAKQDLSDGRVNPRFRIYYQSVEVGYIDHLGNIGGVGNLTFTDSETRGNGYGFFSYLGDQVSEITTGWFTNIYVSQGVNSTNVTTSKVCDGSNCYTPSELNTTSDLSGYYTSSQVDSGFATINEPLWSANFSDTAFTNVEETFSGNITVEGVKLEQDSTNHIIKDNATCVIISGDTSVLYIC